MKRSATDVMSIPGNRDDGRDTKWVVFDRRTKKSRLIAGGDSGMTKAFRLCRKLNAAKRRKQP